MRASGQLKDPKVVEWDTIAAYINAHERGEQAAATSEEETAMAVRGVNGTYAKAAGSQQLHREMQLSGGQHMNANGGDADRNVNYRSSRPTILTRELQTITGWRCLGGSDCLLV